MRIVDPILLKTATPLIKESKMLQNSGIKRCELVYDGGDRVHVPVSMGTAKTGQLQGTVLEQLGELACRVCYDSLGVGRPSSELHKHILEVDNSSVYEHATFVVRFYWEKGKSRFIRNFMGRPGVSVQQEGVMTDVCVNFRSVLEWNKYSSLTNQGENWDKVRDIFEYYGSLLAPQIFGSSTGRLWFPSDSVLLLEPQTDLQKHVSLWLYGSRGFSMEQNRHRTAISQRSTRYVDESESEYVLHPLVLRYLETRDTWEIPDNLWAVAQALRIDVSYSEGLMAILLKLAEAADKMAYNHIVSELEASGLAAGLSKTDARKGGRGAARGSLANCLATEGIYTTSVAHWKWILQKRLNRFADAEIREVYAEVLPILRASRYGSCFSRYHMVSSPDGIGMVLDETLLVEPNAESQKSMRDADMGKGKSYGSAQEMFKDLDI